MGRSRPDRRLTGALPRQPRQLPGQGVIDIGKTELVVEDDPPAGQMTMLLYTDEEDET